MHHHSGSPRQILNLIEGVCEFCQVWIHAARMKALIASVMALLRCGSLSQAAIGRALPGAPKHGIKRFDRLLSNPKMWREADLLYQAVAATMLKEVERPVLLLDWSKVADGFHALTTAVALDGRSLPIFSQVHREADVGDAKVQKRYIEALASI